MSNDQKQKAPKKLGKLLDRFRIKVLDQEFTIELYNQDTSDEVFKKYSVFVNGTQYSVELESLGVEDREPVIEKEEPPVAKSIRSSPEAKPQEPQRLEKSASVTSDIDGKTLTAPMPGKILEIKTNIGDSVDAGQPLVILEAMKMENLMTAPASGIVKDIPIEIGVNVIQGDVLVVIE